MKKMPLIALLLLLCNSAFSQNEIRISYGENVFLGEVAPNTQFTITGNSVNESVKGSDINRYRFERPGRYTISISGQPASEEELELFQKLPDEIAVDVSRVKMVFDERNLTFSTPITKNRETSNIQMSIPVMVKIFDGKPFEYAFGDVASAGIDTSIVGHPVKGKKTLTEGICVVTYKLHGIVTENSYLMFDFIDNNDIVQTVSLLTPVKD